MFICGTARATRPKRGVGDDQRDQHRRGDLEPDHEHLAAERPRRAGRSGSQCRGTRSIGSDPVAGGEPLDHHLVAAGRARTPSRRTASRAAPRIAFWLLVIGSTSAARTRSRSPCRAARRRPDGGRDDASGIAKARPTRLLEDQDVPGRRCSAATCWPCDRDRRQRQRDRERDQRS